jgi:2-oxoglutarate ferredoxin oxidoreductase subunit gamma
MMPNDRFEIRLSGSGGQGIILASVILAQAATLGPANQVCQSQSYGPEARGGKCKADIVISPKAIDYPKAGSLDLLLAMTQEGCDAYFHSLKPGGILVVDAFLVEQLPTSRAVALPFTDLASKLTGKKIAANMAALGALCLLCPAILCRDMEKAVTSHSPKGTSSINRKVFKAGMEAMQAVDLDLLPRAIQPADGDDDEI